MKKILKVSKTYEIDKMEQVTINSIESEKWEEHFKTLLVEPNTITYIKMKVSKVSRTK